MKRRAMLTLVVAVGLAMGNLFSGHSEARQPAPVPARVSLDTSLGGEPASHPVPRILPTVPSAQAPTGACG